MNKLYTILISLCFALTAAAFCTLPRSTYSELEKRELAEMPQFTWQRLWSGDFTADVSAWFSDTEPYRDELMHLSMEVKDLQRITLGEEAITFHANEDVVPEGPKEGENREVGEYTNEITANEAAKIAHAGIVVLGKEPEVRALMAFGGSAKMGEAYAQIANEYQRVLGSGVQVYCMAIPLATEFYLPASAAKASRPQRPVINHIYETLAPEVKSVDVYTTLSQHVAEPIYLRTDHHWAPLGAYYAARCFASVAGVPFLDISKYEKHVIHNFVGTMYGYSRDIAVKRSPEDFVYYTPTGVEYETTYITYRADKSFRVVGESRPVKGAFFAKFKDGSGAAYCTFMGGDQKLTQVRTSTHNGRRLVILKDSYGNALPGYLFGSFEEVHVVDFRYFTKNMKDYVREHHITDVLFAHNIFNSVSSSVAAKYRRFLTQSPGVASAAPEEKKAEPAAASVASHETHTQEHADTNAQHASAAAEHPAEEGSVAPAAAEEHHEALTDTTND